MFLSSGIPYKTQVWIFRGAVFVLPAIAFVLGRRTASRLRESGAHRCAAGGAGS